ncbi:MAG: transporter substrate-binding domain-containing protein [Acidobacteria bacterium]|uniref:Transporter substrate-binding domain-containing protein n=1 Tax=Candidatus Polarisedimenticola svalbardensis TaxID=2886004 RepID=A0A8J7C238_9BACT|nr:transporter substrate-binding domain-containing protein [Candidatus Polarisedimenticola svalbardensis]
MERGYLRILTPPQRLEGLERRGLSVELDLRMAEKLARSLNLKPMIIRMKDRSEMLAALLDGRGDVVIARLARTPLREKSFDFTVPTDRVHEMLVIRTGETEINTLNDLDGLEVAVRESSSFHETLTGIRESVPGLKIRLLPEELDTEEILYRVHEGELQATVADEDMVRETAGYMPGLFGALKLTRKRPIAWALRKGTPELRNAIDAFLYEQAFTGDIPEKAMGDLAAIRERQVLRVLTKNNSATYFMHRGEQKGFEYELARELADSLGLRLQIIVPPRGDLLVPWLREGRGDLIAAAMTVTPEREREIRFSHPYREETEQVVQRTDEPALTGPQDLAGRTVVVRRSSSYRRSLEKLQETVGFTIADAPEEMETEELIAGVAEGLCDLTVADRSILEIERQYRNDVHGPLTIGAPGRLAWAVRQDNENFLLEVNLFLDQHYRGTLFNVLENRYFGDSRRLVRRIEPSSAGKAGLSPYDHLFRKHGKKQKLDWRLLAAQAYQESRFDPDAESWAGAVGVMQVMPETAREMGITGDLTDPEVGIEAGARYLRRLIDLFEEDQLAPSVRLRFALGAYNAGRGHVLDARRIARSTGRDPDRWFDHVEEAMLLLKKAEYASVARFGYCRGDQPRNYVRDITDRYLSYTQIVN